MPQIATHGQAARILLNGVNFGQYLRAANANDQLAAHPSTTFGDDAVQQSTGLTTADRSFEGYWARSGGGLVLRDALLTARAGALLLEMPEGPAFGSAGEMLSGFMDSRSLAVSQDNLIGVAGTLKAASRTDFGVLNQGYGTVSGNTPGAIIDNGAGTPVGGDAFVWMAQVTAITNALNARVLLQHNDDGGVTWLTAAQYDFNNVIGAALITGAGLKRYTRAFVSNINGSSWGTLTHATALARR